MSLLHWFHDQLIGFFGIGAWLTMFQTGNYSSLRTLAGFEGALAPLIPLLLVIECGRAFLHKRLKLEHYKVPFFTLFFNMVVGTFISIGVTAFCIGHLQPYALLKTRFTWYWFIYGYIIWELSHWVYHYLGHKVRLFWCLHSTHHTPTGMNLSVTYTHFFLEGAYADFIRTSLCILLGVNPPLLFLIVFIDSTWGSFIHVGENLIKDARLGFLQRIILTPSHHRVHHGRNPLYMDTNFCNLLNIWDRVLGTYQPESREFPIEYGITREMNPNSFTDAYFGEFIALWKDLRKAPGIKNKLLYIVMPPGWNHLPGESKTAAKVRGEYLQSLSISEDYTIGEE